MLLFSEEENEEFEDMLNSMRDVLVSTGKPYLYYRLRKKQTNNNYNTTTKKTSLNTHHHITALICSLLFCTRMTLSHCFLAISTNSRLMKFVNKQKANPLIMLFNVIFQAVLHPP